MMLQVDYPQEGVQALRSVDKSIPPNAVSPATPDEIYHVDTHPDPETQKEIVLWDDILQAFDKAVHVRHKTRIIPFLKGKDFTILQPRRIAAMPDTILDVIVDTTAIDHRIVTPQIQQQDPVLLSPPTYESTMSIDLAFPRNAPTTSSSSSTVSAPLVATFTARSAAVSNLDEAPMACLSLFERPLAFPSARGPQAALDDQVPNVKDLSTTPRPDNDNRSQLRRPQIATTDVPVEMDVVQTSISASLGDKKAQVALGDMYRDGKGVPQDYQASMDWYLKAVEQGDAAGQHRVGGLYDEGFGVPQNYSTAMDWYLKSADQGYAGSQYDIGEFYYFGQGVRQDYTLAMNWYLKAASQGHALSQYSIGYLYDNGEGVPQDYARAMEWYLKAANQGHTASQHNIAVFHSLGLGVPLDYKQAMDWFLKAAEQGYASAQYNIGFLYDNGEGVPQNYAQAMEWYLKAANQGNALAQLSIGILYNHGRGVPQEFKQAMDWYLKAANQGHAGSQFSIGLLYENGQGVPQDYTKAAEWFSKAADQGLNEAKIELEVLKKKGVVVK